MNGDIDLLDLARTRAIVLGNIACIPGADSTMDGCVDLLDLGQTRAIVLGTQSADDMHQDEHDFSSGAGTTHVVRYKQVAGMPTDIFPNQSGWQAFADGDYTDIEAVDGANFSMAANATRYNAMQCRFTVNGSVNTSAITDLGVTFNGTSDTLEVWAWDFNAGSWSRVSADVTASGAAHTVAGCWGRVLGDYIDVSSHMYVLYIHAAVNRDLDADYVSVELVER
jgi:hypothetical protein